MAFFAVEKKKLSKVWAHPNADRLELGSVEGLTNQFVIGKDEYKQGDEVFYFPIDSVLPDPLIDFFEIRNHLGGKQKNRVKTAKLRGEFSQGFVAKSQKVLEYLFNNQNYLLSEIQNHDYTSMLGVTKYEPPVLFAGMGANLTPLAGFVGHYDIEGCERYPSVVEQLMDKPVWISEKMEGTNFGISIDTGGVIRINQHHHTVTPVEDTSETHTFVKASNRLGLPAVISMIQAKSFPGKNVTLRGELIGPGIQTNIYNLREHEVRFFELEVNGVPVDVKTFTDIWFPFGERLVLVPTLSVGKTLREWLNGKTVFEASNGKSVVNKDILREGIVIKPMTEEMTEWPKLKQDGTTVIERGRLFIKQRSPEYLAKEKD